MTFDEWYRDTGECMMRGLAKTVWDASGKNTGDVMVGLAKAIRQSDDEVNGQRENSDEKTPQNRP